MNKKFKKNILILIAFCVSPLTMYSAHDQPIDGEISAQERHATKKSLKNKKQDEQSIITDQGVITCGIMAVLAAGLLSVHYIMNMPSHDKDKQSFNGTSDGATQEAEPKVARRRVSLLPDDHNSPLPSREKDDPEKILVEGVVPSLRLSASFKQLSMKEFFALDFVEIEREVGCTGSTAWQLCQAIEKYCDENQKSVESGCGIHMWMGAVKKYKEEKEHQQAREAQDVFGKRLSNRMLQNWNYTQFQKAANKDFKDAGLTCAGIAQWSAQDCQSALRYFQAKNSDPLGDTTLSCATLGVIRAIQGRLVELQSSYSSQLRSFTDQHGKPLEEERIRLDGLADTLQYWRVNNFHDLGRLAVCPEYFKYYVKWAENKVVIVPGMRQGIWYTTCLNKQGELEVATQQNNNPDVTLWTFKDYSAKSLEVEIRATLRIPDRVQFKRCAIVNNDGSKQRLFTIYSGDRYGQYTYTQKDLKAEGKLCKWAPVKRCYQENGESIYIQGFLHDMALMCPIYAPEKDDKNSLRERSSHLFDLLLAAKDYDPATQDVQRAQLVYEKAQELINARIDEKYARGDKTLLKYAIEMEHFDIAEYLLKREGVNPEYVVISEAKKETEYPLAQLLTKPGVRGLPVNRGRLQGLVSLVETFIQFTHSFHKKNYKKGCKEQYPDSLNVALGICAMQRAEESSADNILKKPLPSATLGEIIGKLESDMGQWADKHEK